MNVQYSIDSAEAGYFTLAQPGTIQREVFDKNMDESSFNVSIEKVLSHSKHAVFADVENMNEYPKRLCKLVLVWKTPLRKWSASFGLKKNSPYKELLNYALMNFHSFGGINLVSLRSKNFESHECKSRRSRNLSLKKVIIPFAVISIGTCFSILFCLLENGFKKLFHT